MPFKPTKQFQPTLRIRGSLFALLVLVVSPSLYLVAPEPSAQADDAETTEARRRFQEGVRLFDAKKLVEARLAFLQALALRPHPSIVQNLAETEAALQMWQESAAHFEQYLQMPEATEAGKVTAQKGLETARAKLGPAPVAEPPPPPPPAVAPAPPEAVLVLRSSRPGTLFEAFVADASGSGARRSLPLCVAPCEAKVPAGALSLKTSADDQVPGDASIRLSAGERRLVSARAGGRTLRLTGWGLVGASALGLIVSFVRTEKGFGLPALSVGAGLGGGLAILLSRTELSSAPAAAATTAPMLRFRGSF